MELKKQWIFLILCTFLYLNSAGLPRIPKARHYRRRNIAPGTLSPPFPGFNSPGFLRSTVPINKPSSNKPSSNKPSSNKPSSNIPSSNKPSSNIPSSNKPSSNKPSSNKPSSNIPSSNKPSSNKPSSNKPSSNIPSSNKPSSNKPSSNKPSSILTSSQTSELTTIISTSRTTTLKLTKLPNRTSFTASTRSYLVSTTERLPTVVSIFPTDLGTGTTQYSLNVSPSSAAALYQSKSMYPTEKSTQRTTAFSSISSILNTGISTTNLATKFHAAKTELDQSTQPVVVIPVTLSFTFVSTIIFLTGVYILRTRCHRWRIQKVVPQTDI